MLALAKCPAASTATDWSPRRAQKAVARRRRSRAVRSGISSINSTATPTTCAKFGCGWSETTKSRTDSAWTLSWRVERQSIRARSQIERQIIRARSQISSASSQAHTQQLNATQKKRPTAQLKRLAWQTRPFSSQISSVRSQARMQQLNATQKERPAAQQKRFAWHTRQLRLPNGHRHATQKIAMPCTMQSPQSTIWQHQRWLKRRQRVRHAHWMRSSLEMSQPLASYSHQH